MVELLTSGTMSNRMLLLHQGEIVRDFSEEEKKKF